MLLTIRAYNHLSNCEEQLTQSKDWQDRLGVSDEARERRHLREYAPQDVEVPEQPWV